MKRYFLNISALLMMGLISAAKADFISDTLGSAGPSHFAIFTLNGTTDIALNGPGTTVGNVGISGPGKLSLDSSASNGLAINGNVFLGNTATITHPLEVSGTIFTNQDALLNTANTDAINAAATFAALAPTLSVAGNAVTGNTTVNGSAGVNVLNLSNINLGNGQALTLNGPAGSQFVINDSGGFTLNSGHINLSGGVTANDVVINATKSGMSLQTSGGLNNESVINGILLAPNDNIGFAPGLINGELIAGGTPGGQSVHLVSGASVMQIPEPSPLLLFLTALLPVGGAICRRFRSISTAD